jgi:hypothetical protein
VIRTSRLRRAFGLGGTAVLVGAAAVTVPATDPAGAAGGLKLRHSSKHTVVRGVQWWSVTWTNDHGHQQAYVMSVDLSRKSLHLRPAMANGRLNDRVTVPSTANRLHAVGGVNGDLFTWSTYLPWGGIGVGGSVFKTPPRNRGSQFFIDAHGRAGVAPLTFTGSVRQVDVAGRPGARHVLSAVNTPGSADAGNLTLFTSAVSGLSLHRCAAVAGPTTRGVMSVKRVLDPVRHFDRLRPGVKLLAACGKAGRWLVAHAPLGQRLRITDRLRTPSGVPVDSFLSGQRTLRKNGRPFHDRTSKFHTNGINPETAACVSKDRLHVLLITVDGWLSRVGGGSGVTLPELRALTGALHCYTSVVFDGGGSTTMVTRRSGVAQVLNGTPKYYGLRAVPNGLFVVKS